jgi:hypothetical protein
MFWQALGSAALGLALAAAALRWLPGRFPDRRLLLATGPAAALLGGLVALAVMGGGRPLATLTVAAGVSAALCSLLLGGKARPAGALRTGVPVHPPAG